MITIHNVGHGDAIHMQLGSGSGTSHELLIDAGPKRAGVYKKYTGKKVDFLLTHCDANHVSGLKPLMKQLSIDRFIFPLYYPELVRISEWLGKRIKKRAAKIPKSILSTSVQLVAQGDVLYTKAKVLNPPRGPYRRNLAADNIEESIDSALEVFIRNNIGLPVNEIRGYRPRFSPANFDGYEQLARRFVHGYFIEVADLLNKDVFSNISDAINAVYQWDSNQCSVVLRVETNQGYWLLPGDADKAVFNRLIAENEPIKSKFFKAPHHGSRDGFDERILKEINPSKCIISHNNRKFGRSKDPLPHYDILDMLVDNKTEILATNAASRIGKKRSHKIAASSGIIIPGYLQFN